MVVDECDKNDESDPAAGTNGGGDDDFGESSKSESGLDGSGSSWSITAIVKKKITFSKRPMPITTKVAR